MLLKITLISGLRKFKKILKKRGVRRERPPELNVDYGYEDTELLMDAEEDDFVEAFDELGIKKPHRKRILLGFKLLKA